MKKDKLVCPICGEPTNVYMGNARKDRLCKKHGKMANAGEIIQCPDCGKWNEKNVVCKCKTHKTIFNNIVPEQKNNTTTKNEENNIIIIDNKNKSKCITCGKQTDGLLFCVDCYKKYYNKEILIKIKNCREITPLDDFYEIFRDASDLLHQGIPQGLNERSFL